MPAQEAHHENQPIQTTINGDVTEFLCNADESLLDVLRDPPWHDRREEGCGTGDCGACSVTLNGRLFVRVLVLGCRNRRRGNPND